ncbi:DUF4440 domain-containing protein [Gammaproteobacteria bacterium]|nr:DUF4440 domain-containing protein [Gammaproteobacteria bacterium]
MKKLYLIILVLICVNLNLNAKTINESKERESVQKAYYSWCESIAKAKGDPAVVTKFYAPDAILLPTLSHKILQNKYNELDKYFETLTAHKNIKCTPEKLITRMYKKTAINTGLYKFSYMDNGKKMTVPSRFTFIYRNKDGKWLIIKHHSSIMPK